MLQERTAGLSDDLKRACKGLCAAVKLLNQLSPDMQYDRLISFYYNCHHLLKTASTVERKSSCLWAHFSMGFTCYSASSSPAPRGLANHFSLALTWSLLLHLFRMRKSRTFKWKFLTLYQWPSHFWNIYFLALWAGHKSSIACCSHFPTDLPQVSAGEQERWGEKKTISSSLSGGKCWCIVLHYCLLDRWSACRNTAISVLNFSFAVTFFLCFVSLFVSLLFGVF